MSDFFTGMGSILGWGGLKKCSGWSFGIKTRQTDNPTTFAQFSVNYQVTGFDFLTKNFNKKVQNYFIKEELSNKCMADCARRRLLYEQETRAGTDQQKQKEWEAQIQKELLELDGFAHER